MAATFPFVFNAPDASPLRPKGPRARLILPPNVNEPAAIKDLWSVILKNREMIMIKLTHDGLQHSNGNPKEK